MLPTRRTALIALLAPLAGCSALSLGEKNLLRSPGQVKTALRDLVRQTGRDSFQEIEIDSSRIRTTLLLEDGNTQQWTRFDAGWRASKPDTASTLTSPIALPYARLPIDTFPKYARGEMRGGVYLTVDYVGVIQVNVSPLTGDQFGMLVDGSGPVPKRSLSTPEDVKHCVAEIVKLYGRAAERVGSFNGFVHVDLNHTKATGGIRVVRYPRLAANAKLAEVKPFAEEMLFDPSGFDPAIALQHTGTVAKDANVEGKVWDWEFRRPRAGAQPRVSYGIGPNGPSTRVWLDSRGGIDRVVTGECANKLGWCPA